MGYCTNKLGENGRSIPALSLPGGAQGENYVLVFRGNESNKALSMEKKFGKKEFYETNKGALDLGEGFSLASARDFIPLHRDVNLALQDKGFIYDALGNRIDKDRLIKLGEEVNDTWVYLNDTFKKSSWLNKGFLGLNVARIVGFRKNNARFESEPLQECVYNCFADIEYINDQGFYSRKSKTQEFEKGKTVYIDKPKKDYIVRFSADPEGAGLAYDWYPYMGDSDLGGFIRAEGAMLS